MTRIIQWVQTASDTDHDNAFLLYYIDAMKFLKTYLFSVMTVSQ